SAPHAAAEAPLAPAPVAVDLDSDVEEYHSSPNVAGHLAQAQPEPSSPPAQQAQLQPLSPIRPRRAVLLDQDSVPPPMPSSPSSPGSGSPANPSETRASAPPPPGVPAYSSAPPPHLQSSGPRERQNPGSYRYAAGPRGDQDVVTSASLPAGGSPERSSSIPPGDSTPPRARLDALIDSSSTVPPP